MYLLDTDVVSATAPTTQHQRDEVKAWLRQTASGIFISTVTIAEIERGIAAALRIETTAKTGRLRLWLSTIEHLYAERILPFDIEAARMAGIMMDQARGHDMGFADIVIAATARIHRLTVLTANERHFHPLGVAYINPFKGLPPPAT